MEGFRNADVFRNVHAGIYVGMWNSLDGSVRLDILVAAGWCLEILVAIPSCYNM